jgi:DNA-binding CsgD family transcriptional regulator
MREELSPREKQITALRLEGKSVDEIGVLLGISYTTVRHHIQRAYEKTDSHSVPELAEKMKTKAAGA